MKTLIENCKVLEKLKSVSIFSDGKSEILVHLLQFKRTFSTILTFLVKWTRTFERLLSRLWHERSFMTKARSFRTKPAIKQNRSSATFASFFVLVCNQIRETCTFACISLPFVFLIAPAYAVFSTFLPLICDALLWIFFLLSVEEISLSTSCTWFPWQKGTHLWCFFLQKNALRVNCAIFAWDN